jgi:asparagine synthase (glutamine-hydrolysing)
MCGIAGFWDRALAISTPLSVLRAMGDAIRHRGPDGRGEWFDASIGVGFAHRRLSIVDLSDAGAQPMRSACDRWVVTFNGEIYNYEELRKELEEQGVAPNWRGRSDTEVLLACVAEWGVQRTLQKCNGMFAIAIYDRAARQIVLARDRFGEKPLYYGWIGQTLVFSSELKALRSIRGWTRELNSSAVMQLVRLSYVASPDCIYRGLRKLGPGTFVTYDLSQSSQMWPTPTTYWSLSSTVIDCQTQLLPLDRAAIEEQLCTEVFRAVRMRMHADVPLGAFLSGGIDSSIIVAAMQGQSSRKVKTFSIGFNDKAFDESADAREVANHLGTDHTEFHVTHKEATDLVPMLPAIYDEPFGDSSQIPTVLVSRLARTQVIVSLSGDGGDELFGGYNRHAWVPRIWGRLRFVPHAMRGVISRAIRQVSAESWDSIANRLAVAFPKAKIRAPGFKLHKLAGVMDAPSDVEIYRSLMMFWNQATNVVARGDMSEALVLNVERWPALPDLLDKMLVVDSLTYLPDDILVKVDRATMSASLEGRMPFLDPNLFQFAWRIPNEFKVREGIGKWILRQALYRYVPQALVDRPKMGFGVPINAWLRGALRDWAESLLAPSSLADSGMFDVDVVRQHWRQLILGVDGLDHGIWNILMFQAWLRHERG